MDRSNHYYLPLLRKLFDKTLLLGIGILLGSMDTAYLHIKTEPFPPALPHHNLYAQTPPATHKPKSLRLLDYEEIYNNYIQTKKTQPLFIALEHHKKNAPATKFKELIRYMQAKANVSLDRLIITKLAQLGDYNILYELYFNKKDTPYKKVHKDYYYKTLLTIGERKQLLRLIASTIADPNAMIAKEINYLRLLTQKETNPDFFYPIIANLNKYSAQAQKLSTVEQQFVQAFLTHQVLYYLKKYSKLVSLLKDTTQSPPPATTRFTELKQFNKNIKRSLLEQLFYLGYYDSYLNLAEVFTNEVTVNKNKLETAAYFSKNKTYHKKYAQTSQKLKQKISFYANDYEQVIATIGFTSRSKQQNLSQSSYYVLSLAALEEWIGFRASVAELPPAHKKAYTWIEPLFKNTPQSRSETLRIVQTKSPSTLTTEELYYLNFRSELTTAEEIALLHETMRRILIKDLKLNAYIKAQGKNLPPPLREYALSELARHYLDQGFFEKTSDLFRTHYQSFSQSAFKEKLYYFHGLASFYNTPKEGRLILERFLSIYPKSSYRLEIEETFKKILF
ncbi:hypothetical protein COTS27_01430 [Spirochaetota bacterium]|nr:hypothetical protein COTS27_01430 [Spirochaetota bacterium]